MIIPVSEEKPPVKSSHSDDEESSTQLPTPDQNPPPYSPLPQRSSTSTSASAKPTQPLNLPPDLASTNYIHVKEKNNGVKRKILLDLSVPRPPASAFPTASQGEDIPHLTLDSYNGSVTGEVWLLRAKPAPARERAHLHFHSHNGSVKALVHIHPSTVEPRPFLSIEAKADNGGVTIVIPRSFRGQLTLHTEHGQVILSSALAPRAATLSTVDGTHSYFVGERPSSGKWHTGTSEDGEEVDEVIGSSKNGTVRVSYDDEDASGRKGPGVLSTLFKAMMGF